MIPPPAIHRIMPDIHSLLYITSRPCLKVCHTSHPAPHSQSASHHIKTMSQSLPYITCHTSYNFSQSVLCHTMPHSLSHTTPCLTVSHTSYHASRSAMHYVCHTSHHVSICHTCLTVCHISCLSHIIPCLTVCHTSYHIL